MNQLATPQPLTDPLNTAGPGRSQVEEDEAGQATAEYALIIAAAAAIAALLLTWAARTDAIGRLFNAVMDHVINSI